MVDDGLVFMAVVGAGGIAVSRLYVAGFIS